jgi:hypothetical protein
MRVRVDVYLGDDNRLDISFLEKRERWLPFTGVYLEFMLKGTYEKQINFELTPSNGNVCVTRHSWNRFFVNVQDTDTLKFVVTEAGLPVLESKYKFNVVDVKVPLMFSILNLFSNHTVSDVRFFANRLSENMVNGTRIQFFTPKVLEKLAKLQFSVGDGYWRFYELLFSILTERGIRVYITPFGHRVPYPLPFLEKLKPVLWDIMERGKKFKIVWDFSEGLRRKELRGLVDSAVSRFGNDVSFVVTPDMYERVGGEGYSYTFLGVKMGAVLNPNEKGVKIVRLREPSVDFNTLHDFVGRAVEMGYGVEYICYPRTYNLHKLHYSMSRALYQGYRDFKMVKTQ